MGYEDEFGAEVWEQMKKKYNLSPCPDCENIKKDALRMEEYRCVYCMFYWRG